MLLNVFFYQRDNPLRLRDIHVFGRGIIHALFHIDKFNACVRFVFIAAGEGDELIMVDLLVRKGDQVLMPAPVMPQQCPVRENIRRLLQDGVEHFLRFLIPVIAVAAVAGIGRKEIGGRQLPGVPGNDDLLRPENGPDGVLREDLGSLIEDDHIKLIQPGIQEIRHGQRGHHQAGLEGQQQSRNAPEELAKGHNAPLLFHLMPQNPQLGSGFFDPVQVRIGPDDLFPDALSRNVKLPDIQFNKPLPPLLVHPPAEALHGRHMIQLSSEPAGIKSFLKGRLHLPDRVIQFGNPGGKFGQAQMVTFRPRFHIVKPFVEFTEPIHAGLIAICNLTQVLLFKVRLPELGGKIRKLRLRLRHQRGKRRYLTLKVLSNRFTGHLNERIRHGTTHERREALRRGKPQQNPLPVALQALIHVHEQFPEDRFLIRKPSLFILYRGQIGKKGAQVINQQVRALSGRRQFGHRPGLRITVVEKCLDLRQNILRNRPVLGQFPDEGAPPDFLPEPGKVFLRELTGQPAGLPRELQAVGHIQNGGNSFLRHVRRRTGPGDFNCPGSAFADLNPVRFLAPILTAGQSRKFPCMLRKPGLFRLQFPQFLQKRNRHRIIQASADCL